MSPLRFQLSCGKSVKYRFIEFLVFDYGSLPYLFSLFLWSDVAFALVAPDKILHLINVFSTDRYIYIRNVP